ncbi:MAG: NUDIX domain-containing protein [candidate division SR1 bacterium]|nr:NUDIX domain-containing protein [candidate division SR1 bacterium]
MTQSFGIAVKGLIQNPEGKYLIIYKSDLDEVNPNDFDIPGGRINRGEKIEDALHREIKEEVGLKVVIQKLNNTRGFTKEELHLVGITFLATCSDYEHITLSHEHTGFQRRTKEEILNGDFPAWLKEEFQKI